MSYILEALRRAERERAQGQIPGVDAAGAAAAPPAGRGPVLKIVVALLAINALVLIVLLMRHKPDATKPALAEPIAQQPLNLAAPPPTAPITAPVPAPADAGTLDEAVVQEGVSSMDDLGAEGEEDDTASETTPHVEHQLPRGGTVTFSQKPLTRPAVKPPPPADPENDIVDAESMASAPEETYASEASELDEATEPPSGQVASAQPITRSAPPSAALPAGTSVKPLSDMSAAYQAAFPQLVMEVHVYDPVPQKRFAIIGGKRYHEGDALAQGPRIVQIVAEGLVVDFRNERVLYPIGRH